MAAPYVRGRVGELAAVVLERVDGVTDRMSETAALDRGELLHIATLIRTRAERVAETATAVPRPLRGGRRLLRRPAPQRE